MAQLKASSSASTKVTVLRCMKNIVIGHQDKKSLATDDFLQSLIDACTHVEAGKRRSPARVDINASLSTEESVRLEAIYIIGSLSRGNSHCCAGNELF